jgi:pyridinium-3,5-bisthiocarboxylic acid mononucleotide nickel chelatase
MACGAHLTRARLSMRIAYLDCFSGISGDMFLGALVDAGVSPDLLRETVRGLDLGAELEITRVDRNGITATKVDVIVNGEKDMPREELAVGHSHSHEHTHADGTTHSHEHAYSHEHLHSHGRSLQQIREIISASSISAKAKQTAIAIFQALGEAEGKIHNKPIDDIHFHEVGSVDAIVDITCAAVGAEALKVEEWVCSPLNVGGGTVQCAHGTLPVPAPATLELLKGAPIYSSDIKKELLTPTGAAIVKTLVSRFASFPTMTTDRIGYGAGFRNFDNSANVVRLTIGESSDLVLPAPRETITIIEANLDDLSPQVFGYVIDKLLEAGALDAFGLPVQMKKSRPGVVLTVLARPEDAQRLAKIIFAETTTIGLRMRNENRYALVRRHQTVETQWGAVRMKIANLNGTIANYAPEYEDCRAIAEQHNIPLKQVMQEAVRIYLGNKD